MSSDQRSLIGNRYQVDSQIGSGGMGLVYKGLDTQTGQTIAIKHLKPDMTDHDMIERFKREGQALRDLNHPNIVKMLDTVEEDGNQYLIIEYLSGGDLNELLHQEQLPIEKILRLAIDIGDALTRAHRLNIIHRDLKPANVLLAQDGTPRLTDFGIALLTDKARVTENFTVIGTLNYMPPEALNRETLDNRADIWAFGIMLFEMLSGETPFSGNSISNLFAAILRQPTPDLESLRPDAPVALVDLVYRMLEKDRHARIKSVRHVGAALEDILFGRITATPPEPRFVTPTLDTTQFQRPQHNLPAQTTPFVGRESELSELARLLDDPSIRLITIVGPGGMGKTRLALECADRDLANFKNGAYLIELAPLNDVTAIVPAIADATDYQFQSDGRERKQQVLDFLSNKQMLLVLDNFEHLLNGAELVSDMLKAAPHVKILATSRQRLSQAGEALFHLSGMDFPNWQIPEDALSYAAIKLFMNSARRAQSAFELTVENLNDVARICRLVDGMPLGIVLAAAWLSLLSPQEIVSEIEQSIDFLETGGGEVPERQRSIRAVFEQAWLMMTDAEQQVFRQLSVFQGGFTREAAQAVAGATLRVLMSLLSKSLIRRDVDSGRYTIQELLRQYSATQLAASGDTDAILWAYSNYYCQWMHEQSRRLYGHGQKLANARLQSEKINLTEAWLLAIEHGDEASLMKGADWWFAFEISANYREGHDLFLKALNRVSEDNRLLRGKLKSCLGVFTYRLHQFEPSEQYSRQSIALLEGTAEHFPRLVAQLNLGNILWRTEGPDAGEVRYEATAAEARALGEHWLETASLTNLSIIANGRGDYDRAESLLNESLALRQVRGDLWGQAYSLINLASLHLSQNRYDEARIRFHDTLAVSRQIGLRLIETAVLLVLAYFDSLDGVLDTATEHFTHAKRIVSEMNLLGFKDKITAIEARLQMRGGDPKAAQTTLVGYLETTTQGHAVVLSLMSAAELLAEQDRNPRAVEITSLLMDYTNDAIELDMAGKRLLDALKSKMSAASYTAALEHGKSLDLATVVQEIVADFTSSAK